MNHLKDIINTREKCRNAGLALLLVIGLAFLLGAVFKGDKLKGTWDMGGTTVYQFDGRGNGAMILPSSTYEFVYEISKDKKQVSIDFEDERAKDYTYDFAKEGKKLILSGTEGTESFRFEFQRIKNPKK